MRRVVATIVAGVVAGACTSGGNNFDGGTDGGRAIGDNPNVTQSCQTCLGQSSGNDCDNKRKNCTSDSLCVALNDCINKCASVNTGCINNCGNSASADAIAEWNAWYFCTCADCTSQCATTFCTAGDAGSDATPDTGPTCIADQLACSQTQPCCTFCASDQFCGCEPTNDGCVQDGECCSNFCDQGSGTCQ